MRRILFFILLLFLGCQLTAVNGQHSSDTIVNVSKSQYVKDLFLQAEKSWFSGNFDDACEKCFKVIEYVEKPVVKKVYRKKYVRNPIEFFIVGSVCFIVGLIFGLLL